MSGFDPTAIEDIYELSPMQQAMLLDGLTVDNEGMYRILFAYNIEGPLDEALFKQAWQEAAKRHPVLRTSVHYENLEKPLQVVHREVELPVEFVDLQGRSKQEQDAEVERSMEQEKSLAIDISVPPLMSLKAFRTGPASCWLLWVMHHIVIEGWSASVVLEEVLRIYAGLLSKEPVTLKPLLPYREYISWVQQLDEGENRQYWQKQLKGVTAPTPLNVDIGKIKKLSAVIEYESDHAKVGIDTSATLNNFARNHKITVNTLIRAAWSYLLSRYSGNDDVVFGAIVSGRTAPLDGIESMVGLTINLLPVRVCIPHDETVINWLTSLQSQQMEMAQYEHISHTKIKAWSEVEKSVPMFETLIIFENWAGDVINWKGPLKVTDFKGGQVGQGYPISIVVLPGENIEIELFYDTTRFDSETIRRLFDYFLLVLKTIPAIFERKVSELPNLTEVEYKKILHEFAGSDVCAKSTELAHQLIERNIAINPDVTAVVSGNEKISYRELNERANQLAHALRDAGVGPDTIVGISMQRSVLLLVAVLATLKSGGAYLALDPTYPADRLSFMVEDAEPAVILTTADLRGNLPETEASFIVLSDENDWLSKYDTHDVTVEISPDNLVYIIYTSGSTGKPKGVQVTHRNLVNSYYGWEQVYGLSQQPVNHLQMANFSFDVFTEDMLRALATGGKLVLAPHEFVLSPERLYQLMLNEDVVSAEFVPAVMRAMVNYLDKSGQRLDFLRTVYVGADSWNISEYKHLKELCSEQTRVINTYGLTEATIDNTCFEGDLSHKSENGMVPIGRPFPGTRVYILDRQLKPVPVGVPGELCVAGVGVSRGYLNREELTREKFITDPFSDSGYMYRTGDLARFLHDGNIELLGRIDHQVKLRGFRVEIGEIESAIAELPDIKQAVATVREDRRGNRRLVAYLVTEKDKGFNSGEIRGLLRQKLPEYMVPSVFQVIESLPISPNGKVDRSRLPAPDDSAAQSDIFTAPENEIQTTIAAIWQEVLSVDRVGIHENFFDLGGHSLLLMAVRTKLNDAFGTDIPIVELFEHSTVSEQARLFGKKQRMEDAVEPVNDNRGKGQQRLREKRTRMQNRC